MIQRKRMSQALQAAKSKPLPSEDAPPAAPPSGQRSEGVRLTLTQALIASWGVLGVLLLLAQASYRLGVLAVEAHQMSLGAPEWFLSLSWIAFNAYAEGYRAFQQRFSPRVVVRALHLAKNPTPIGVLLAPAYCMAFFHASRRAQTLAWATLAMILSFIFLLRQVPQPWRGIVDGGVVVALLWGGSVILVLFLQALVAGRLPDASPELPK